MILIVGGACQGKKNYAKEHYGENYTIVDEYHKKVKVALKNGDNPIKKVKDGSMVVGLQFFLDTEALKKEC